jgi:hypothetical protein
MFLGVSLYIAYCQLLDEKSIDPDILEGDATRKNDQGQTSIFRHMREQRDDKKKATDKPGEEEGKMILVRKKNRIWGRR